MKSIIICTALLTIAQGQPQESFKEVYKNNMRVRWKIAKKLIHFKMEAPTEGWVSIGFNEKTSLTGTYLLMGRIRNGKAEVVEHYTEEPGSYKPITNYGIPSQTSGISGNEKGNTTSLQFSIPVERASKYHKHLLAESKWTLPMAYSLEDDFQHHSMMRTSVEVKL